nr:tetratricopeptide repeat protein 28-like [Pocillopora verrucosa]
MAESNLPKTGEELELKNEFPATATEESQVTSSDAELDVYNDPLRGIAKVCLEEGNKEYRKGEANNAINSYTEGLQVNCNDTRLNAKLYSNRAAAHFHLANYVECLDDATVAVQLEPVLIKAIKKGARACVELCWYKEARSWLLMGLAIDNNNKSLLQLIRKSNAELKVKAYTYASLGCAYFKVGQFHTAIEYHQKCLEIAKEVGDKAGEGRSYGNLGNAYDHLGEFKTAIKYHQRHLEIAKEVGDKAGEGRSYGNLGNAYQGLGEFKTAIKYHQRHLEIAKEVGDKAGEGISYGNLGNAYRGLGEFKTAIKYHQRHLEIAKEVGDKAGEGKSYGNLGNAYDHLGEFKTAIKYHQRHLEIAKEVGDKAGEGKSYGNLGNAYRGLGEFKTAIKYHQRHLEIAKEVGDKAGEGISYGNLGNAYNSLGEFKTAIKYHQRHLEIAKEVGDKAGEGISYGNLGNAYQGLGEFKTAIKYHQRDLEIAKEVGDKAGEGISYGNLGNAYRGLGEFKTAIKYHQRHLEIAKEVGDKAGEGKSYGNLGNAYKGLRQLKTAIEYYQRDLEIAKQVGDKTGEACSLCSLGRSFECQGNLMMAIHYYHSSVELYDDIRASLRPNDQWTISYRNQHQSAYRGLWRIHLNQGKVVEALLAAEKGRAQALRDLMATKYQPGDSSTQSASCVSLSWVPLSTVFIAINGPCVYFWVCLSEDNIQMREVHVNNYKYEDELEVFIKQLNKTALKEIGARDTVTIETPPFDSSTEEEVANDVIRVDFRQLALESQGVFGYQQNADIWTRNQ